MGYKFDINNPQTFNEKLQWLKLHDRKPEYTTMVDKVAAKEYVANKIGKEYIIPTIGVWDNVSDITWDSLPNAFVLKATGGGGGSGVVVCKNKSELDKQKAVAILKRAQKGSIYRVLREWPYKNVPNRILAEELLSDGGEDLCDYKVHCFNGMPKVILCCRDRFKKSGLTEDFFDENWEHLDLKRPSHQVSETAIPRPQALEEMLRLSVELSKDIPFLRTDFYTSQGKVFFGELTFYPASGMKPFQPEKWDKILGEWLTIPTENGGGKMLIKNGFALWVHTQKNEELYDYKFFCFNGHCEFFKVDFGRFVEHHANYYNRECSLLPFGEANFPPVPDYPVYLPSCIPEMIGIAENLSKGIPFLRVDLYECGGHIFFGEMTFYPASGMGKFTEQDIDRKLGEKLILPKYD